MKIKIPIDGILLLNKPSEISSNTILQKVKHLFQAKKAGHTGTLDPLATGMLPICFGEATKFSQFLLDADKCYEVTALLGIKTSTADSTGEIIAKSDADNVMLEDVQQALSTFIGHTTQVPSMYSALKHQGVPLYKYARQGIEVERSPRSIYIKKLELLAFKPPYLSLNVVCSKGTYVRNLVEDLGELLNTHAHVTRLHRLYTAGFENERMFTYEELESFSPPEREKSLLAVDHALTYLAKFQLTEEQTTALQQGKVINIDQTFDGLVRLYLNEMFVGLGECLMQESVLRVKRLISTALK